MHHSFTYILIKERKKKKERKQNTKQINLTLDMMPPLNVSFQLKVSLKDFINYSEPGSQIITQSLTNLKYLFPATNSKALSLEQEPEDVEPTGTLDFIIKSNQITLPILSSILKTK